MPLFFYAVLNTSANKYDSMSTIRINKMRQSIMSGIPVTESINFQEGTFFKELVLAFEVVRKLNKKDIADSEEVGNIGKIINHHTGLDVTLSIADAEPSVHIPMVNKNNVLINSFVREFLNSSDGIKMINNADGVVRGTVNLKTGKVTGIFTEVKSTINMPLHMLTETKFTCEENAAILLHEVGHLVTYYEYIARSVTTNQMLAGLSKALDQSGSVEEREAVLVNVKKAMSLTDLDTKELAKSTNKHVAEIVVVTNVTKQTVSELGSNIYDFSTWEYLSDQYAARQGAGRHLVTGLEKIYKGHWNISFRSLPAYLAMEAVKLTMLVFVPILGPGALGVSILLLAIDGSGDGTYDRPGARFIRVRDQIVENLKDKNLTPDDRARLTADLETIHAVLKQINDRRQFFGVLWDNLIPGASKALDQERLQKELEAIAVNDLFVKSAELKQL